MDKYTFNDLLANPENPDLESLIGKEVYYSNVLLRCVSKANEDIGVGILRGIHKDDYLPFLVETSNGNDSRNYACFACIIPKKKEKPEPKYEPFKNLEEFLGAHSCVNTNNLDRVHRYLDAHGIWLKEKGVDYDIFCMVNELWKDGVFVGSADVVIDDDGVANTDFASWYDLYMGYTFLDGSPCGKKVEENNELCSV